MNEIYILDDKFNTIAVFDYYKSLIWSNRYYKIGDFMNIVFGGSFNPITKAHLDIINKLKEKFNPENVIILPASDNYTWKNLTKSNDRLNMIKLVCKDCIISDYELKQSTYKGTINSLNYLSKTYKDLYFCMGADNLEKFDK